MFAKHDVYRTKPYTSGISGASHLPNPSRHISSRGQSLESLRPLLVSVIHNKILHVLSSGNEDMEHKYIQESERQNEYTYINY